MSISSAMQTGVSGLYANSTAVGKISENIANANTDGYKRQFSQMVTTTASGANGNAPSGVEAVNTADVSLGGTMQSTSSPTDLAVNGNGFFVVTPSANDAVESDYMLTRAGSFKPDANGNLVNAAGYYLAGYAYKSDGTLGPVDRSGFSGMSTVNVRNASLPPAATTTISVQGNLPSQQTGLTTPGAPFTSSTAFFSPLGQSGQLQFSWQPTSTANKWTMTVSDNSGNTYGSVDIAFNDSGANAGSPVSYSNVQNLATAPAAFSLDPTTGIATLSINNGATPQSVTLKLGAPNSSSGITQFAGDFTPQTFDKDGSPSSNLSRVEVDSSGNLIGVFDNGDQKKLYQIPLGNVTNPDGLTLNNGNAYKLSTDSGAYSNQPAGSGSVGTIASKSLEASNVDIAQELSNLIVVQRAYSTDAKIVTTMDQMLSVTTQLKQ